MRGTSSGGVGPALLALLRRTAAASSTHPHQFQQHQAGAAATAAGVSSLSSSTSIPHPPAREPPSWGSQPSSTPLLPRSAAAAAAAASAVPPQQQQHRNYAKKGGGASKGAAASKGAGKLSGAAVSASPDDPDAQPPPPRVRPPFTSAARRRRRALLPAVPRAARDALAALAALSPAGGTEAEAGATEQTKKTQHLLRDVAWPLDQRDALVLLHDATFGDTTGPGHTLYVPHVTHDILQSAQGVASFVKECIQDGVEFSRVEQFFVQTLAHQAQEQASEEGVRHAEEREKAAARAKAAAEMADKEQQEQGGTSSSAGGGGNESSPTTTRKKTTGIVDLPDRPFKPPRLLVRGMRIQIKGRLRGKGGKAEKKAWSWGATSAANFADAVDYAQAQAETRAGTVGVRVWLVFREDAFDRESYALLRRRARCPDTGKAIWRGPGWAADAVEELATAARSQVGRATGEEGVSAVRRPATAWWSTVPDADELAAFAAAGGGEAAARRQG